MADIKLAVKNLERKHAPLHALHYGDVRFLLAYAAAGHEYQWLWVSSDGKMVSTLCPGSHHMSVTVIMLTDKVILNVFRAAAAGIVEAPQAATCTSILVMG